MTLKRLLLGLLIVFGYSIAISAQTITPRIDTLVSRITTFTYANQFDSAQTLVLNFLDQSNLSPTEFFYGHFLFADIVKSSGQPKKAITLLVNSRTYLENVEGNALFESLIYGNIGECYFNQGDYASAKEQALLSLEVSPDSSFRGSGHAVNHLIVGFSYFSAKDYTEALSYYNLAIEEYLAYGEPCELPLCYIKIALIHNAKGNLELGEATFHKAILLSDSCGIDHYKALTRSYLLDFYKQENQHKNALDLIEEINVINGKIARLEHKQFIETLGVEYETKITKKENENLKESVRIQTSNSQLKTGLLIISIIALFIILMLSFYFIKMRDKKNAVLSKQLVEIESQNKEREALLKEVHHRVKNNLQVITSLLSLQVGQIDEPKTRNLFQQSQYRINSMAMVHEMLYQSDSLSGIKIESYLEELVSTLVNSIKGANHKVKVSLDVPSINLRIDTAIPLGLLINEVLVNALIHGINDNEAGEIHIRLEEHEHPNFNLYIGDSGSGYPEEITFSTSSTLGLRLMHKLSRQLLGSIERDFSKNGCHYKIAFQEIE
jgi:two-component sensor histidine kinase